MPKFTGIKDWNQIEHIDVRGTQGAKGVAGGDKLIKFGFVRRTEIGSHNWALQFVGNGADMDTAGADWAVGPLDAGGGVPQARMNAWNEVEQGRRAAAPANPKNNPTPLNWGSGAPPPSLKTTKWHKKFDDVAKGPQMMADGAKELAKDIVGTGSRVGGAVLQTLRPDSVWEEIKTEFFMEAIGDELQHHWYREGQKAGGKKLSKERTGDFNKYVSMINTKSMDFARYSEYEMAEMDFFQELMQAAWEDAGGSMALASSWSDVMGREQTSDWTGKFFARALSEGAIEDAAAASSKTIEPGSVEAHDLIKRVWSETAQSALNDVSAYINDNYQGDILQTIWKTKSIKKGKATTFKGTAKEVKGTEGMGIETLSYYGKQAADRAITTWIWETLAKGVGSYDYYMPIPTKSTLGFAAGSFQGILRIFPQYTEESLAVGQERFGKERPKFTRFDSIVDAIYVGGMGTSGGVPINVILNFLLQNEFMGVQLNAEAGKRIAEVIAQRLAKHAQARSSTALVGGMFSGILTGKTTDAYVGSLTNVAIAEIAAPAEIAKNVKAQFKDFAGDGSQFQDNLKKWYQDQIIRANKLAQNWRQAGSGWWEARANWRTGSTPFDNKGRNEKTNSQRSASESKSSMFWNDSAGGKGVGTFTGTKGEGQLVGTPFFLQSGPFDPKKWSSKRQGKWEPGKGKGQMMMDQAKIAGGGRSLESPQLPAWSTKAGSAMVMEMAEDKGYDDQERFQIRMGEGSWVPYEEGVMDDGDSADRKRLRDRRARFKTVTKAGV